MTLHIPIEIAVVLLGACLSVLAWIAVRIERMHTRLTRLEAKFEMFEVVARPAPRKGTHALGLGCLVAASVLTLGSGCMALRAKGGLLSHGQTVTRQPENPKDGASQRTDRTIEIPLPAGSQVAIGSNVFRLAGDSIFRDQDKTESKIGGSQYDSVGTVVAKLKSARWMTLLGCLAVLGGLGAAFWPPARAVMGGTTPGFAVSGGGLVIAMLPYIVIGNEKFLMVSGLVTALACIAAIFLYRHGGHGRELSVLRKFVSPQADKLSADPRTKPGGPATSQNPS